MTIAMVSSWRVPCGIARYTEELVAALQSLSDCSVKVLPVGPQVWRQQQRPLGWRWERFYWYEVCQAANEADVVHIQFTPAFFGGLKPFRNLLPFVLKRLKKPSVLTVHEVDLTGSLFLRFVKRWEQKRLLAAGKDSLFIGLNRFVALQLLQLGCSQVVVLSIWVPSLAHPVDSQTAKERLGLTGRFVITAFGFIVERRGYETLLKVFPSLPSDTFLVLAGGPHPLDRSDYYPRLMTQIAEHPCRTRIHVTGYLSEEQVDEWLAASDVVVAPYRNLSGSASLMRALAHGKPILASDLPPLRELAEQSNALWLIPPDQPEVWAEALQRLRKDAGLREQLSAAAQTFAQHQTVHRIAERHRALYAAVLAGKAIHSVLS